MKRTFAAVLVALMTILCIGGGYSESDALSGGIEAEEIIPDQLPEPEQESEEDMATGDKLVNLDDLKVAYDKQQEDTNALKSAINSINDVIYYETDNLLDFVTEGFWVRKNLDGSDNVYSITTANKIPVTGGSELYTALKGLSTSVLGNGFVIRVRQFDANDTQVGSDTTFSTITSTNPVHYTLNAAAAKILIMLTTNDYNKQITPEMFQEMNPLIYAGFNSSITNETVYHKYELVTDEIEDKLKTKVDKLIYKTRNGYIGGNGNFSQPTSNNEITAYGISCEQGEKYRVYIEQNNDGASWVAWCAYNTQDGLTAATAVGQRASDFVEFLVTKQKRYSYIDITIPTGAVSFAFSYRQYTGAYFLLFKIAATNAEQDQSKTAYETELSTLNKVNDISIIENTASVKSINHRGYNSIAPENTIPAFKLSRRKGFKVVEADVRMTSDNVPVLLHDDTINRTARNADGTEISGTVYINSITYEQALQYDFGIWKSFEYAGTKIPTLEQFLTTCKYIGIDAYIEIKDYNEQKVHAYIDVAKKTGMIDHVTWICFDVYALTIVKEYTPTARIGLLANSIDATIISNAQSLKTAKNDVFINAAVGAINTATVNMCISAEIAIEAWTVYVNDLPLDSYVTGMTSDVDIMGYELYNRNID